MNLGPVGPGTRSTHMFLTPGLLRWPHTTPKTPWGQTPSGQSARSSSASSDLAVLQAAHDAQAHPSTSSPGPSVWTHISPPHTWGHKVDPVGPSSALFTLNMVKDDILTGKLEKAWQWRQIHRALHEALQNQMGLSSEFFRF